MLPLYQFAPKVRTLERSRSLAWKRQNFCEIDTSRICLSAHKTIEAGNENRLFTMDYIARLDFMLLFCVHSSKFGKCLLRAI
jgi:hypothetical protein